MRAIILPAAVALLALGACSKQTGDNAAAAVDSAVNDTSANFNGMAAATDNAADSTGAALDNAAAATGNAASNAADATGNALHDAGDAVKNSTD